MSTKSLAELSVSDLVASQTVIFLDASQTVPQALQVLTKADIYGAPIRDASGTIAWFDLQDVATFIVHLFASAAKVQPSDTAALQEHIFSKEDLTSIKAKFNATHAKDIANLSGQNPYRTMLITSSVQQVVDFMIINNVGRIPLVNNEGQIVHVITQATIIKYLAEHVEYMGELAHKTVGELGIGSRPVGSVYQQVSAIAALSKLVAMNVSHLAITDGEGVLVANLSVKDLKVLLHHEEPLGILLNTVLEFVHTSLRENLKSVYPAVHGDYQHTLERLVKRLAVVKIHRLYLTETPSSKKPVGVVTMKDALKLFSSKK